MVSYLNAFKATFRTTSHRFRSTGGRLPVELPGDGPVEEETLPHYEPDQFYRVDPGDVFNDRSKNFVTMKVSTSLRKFPTATDREFKIYEHLASIKSTHPGQSLIRELWDSFELTGGAGKHRCLILQPMHMTLLEMMKLNPRPFNLPLLKMTLTRLLLALDFLHTEAHIMHCGTAYHDPQDDDVSD
nr:srsf protein kinase 3 [Quercus suber]